MSSVSPNFDQLDAAQRTWLGLAALMPDGVRSDAIDRVCRDGNLISTVKRWSTEEISRSIAAAGLVIPLHHAMGFQLRDPPLRRKAIDLLVRSGSVAQWVAQFNLVTVHKLWPHQYSFEVPQQVLLAARLALIGGISRKALLDALARFPASVVDSLIQRSVALILVYPIDEAQLHRLHSSIRLDVCLRQLAQELSWPQHQVAFWHHQALRCIAPIATQFNDPGMLSEHALRRLDLPELDRFNKTAEQALLRQTAVMAISADHAHALAGLQTLYDMQTPERGSVRVPLPWLAGVLHALALAADPSALNLTRLTKIERGFDRDDLGDHANAVRELARFARAIALAQPWSSVGHPVGLSFLFGWVNLILSHWSGQPLAVPLNVWASETLPALRNAGWTWLAEHFAAALGDGSAKPSGPWAWRLAEQPWQRALRAIETFATPLATNKAASKNSRIRVAIRESWDDEKIHMEVREQRPASKGGWSSGRLLDTPKAADDAIARIDPDDAPTLELLKQWRRCCDGRHTTEVAATSSVIDALVGYPHVVSAVDNEKALSVVKGHPRLRIQRDDSGNAKVEIDPPAVAGKKRTLQWLPEQLRLTEFDAATLMLAGALGTHTNFPEAALPALLALAPQLSRRIEVDADFGASTLLTEVDSRIHVIIEPLREGLRLRLRTRPLGVDGVYFVPACGPAEILGIRDGAPLRGRRMLRDEHDELQSVLQAIPILAGAESSEDVDIPMPETALETLSQLLELGDRVQLDWSQHRRWALSRKASFAQLSIKVRAQRDWFHAEGGLKLDDGQVVSLASLLEALPSTQGRFVRLADDRIIALSQDLARQLRQVQALADGRGRLQLAPVAAAALQPLIESGADIDLDQAFQAQLQRISKAQDSQAKVPNNLQAELRDYQIEGYRWLMRLASWGAGACLADDMGLGKTLQALAMLLARAGAGPAIVVAPTSVVANWRSEAERFAPSLELRVYGEGDRVQALDQLGPGCVLLVSYGLLTVNIDSFAELRFATLVLDEAQAIKNAAAQRTLAIRRVQADFRVATTGTPIENHLGELWSLMRVLNPGLLGSQEHFAKRFMAPIERNPRGAERETLRRVISPFMLRRLKSQVLTELPPRTEIILTIEPSAGEAKLLAAIRRQAIDRLDSGGMPEEAKRFHVLAEITRLRRAACHPSLVAPELNLSGAKLEQLLELVSDLRENRHRALVFSQFVDYLDLVRAAFDQAGISYQYLDGSTTPKAREAAVKAFQAGQGDVFLLSLKAGGVGLNLTAADYVIHLDPWWNPAVEQQATDRAHRIGQTRPVTVYKLVVKGSIEEQILALHGSKREIADSVLADQDVATRMNVSELLGLLQN